MSMTSGSINTNPVFSLSPVTKTNLYQGVITAERSHGDCSCSTWEHKEPGECSQPGNQCECPCWSGFSYRACSNTFSLSDSDPNSCIPEDIEVPVYGQLRYEYEEYNSEAVKVPTCYN